MKRVLVLAIMAAFFVVGVLTRPVPEADAAGITMKACAAALKATKGKSNIKYKSDEPLDFEAITMKRKKNVKSMYYVTSDNGVYCICVVKAKNSAEAKKLKADFKKYKTNQINGMYFKKDYTKKEQEVMKTALVGGKGKYVWYISMSNVSAVNYSGQAAVQKLV